MGNTATVAEYRPTLRHKIKMAIFPSWWHKWVSKYRKSNIEVWAEEELRRAGLYDKDSDYAGMIGPAVLDIMKVFGRQGHSGGSASVVYQCVSRLLRWKALSPLTSDPSEWCPVASLPGPMGVWQSRRQSSCFSEDHGKTYYDIDDENRKIITAEESHHGKKD